MYFKKLQDFIIKELPKLVKENIISLIFAIFTGGGVWGMSDSIIGGISLSVGLFGTIWLIQNLDK